MEIAKVREIVNDNVRWLICSLQLQQWKINIYYEPIQGTIKGTCKADPKYREAEITFDAQHLENEKDVLDTLRHELIHIMLAQFHTYRKGIMQIASDKEGWILDTIYDQAIDEAVWHVETVLTHGLGYTPKRMIAAARRRYDK